MPGRPGWLPDQSITPELVAPVIAAQFPDLAGLPVTPFAQGWDNAVLAVGERWLLRVIHRTIALPGARRELAVLNEIGPRLSLPVPRPQLVGRPTPDLPWPFWLAERLPGEELAALDQGLSRVQVAAQMGTFLRGLHGPAHAATGIRLGLAVDPIGRGDPRTQSVRAGERITSLRSAGRLPADPAVDAVLADAAELSGPSGAPVLVHGDLHLRHVLVLTEGERSCTVGGVIDWGDTSLAPPAVDLMLAFAAFDGDARAGFVDAYGPISAQTALHARVVALAVSAALAQGAVATDQADLATAALAAITRAAH